MAVTDSLGRFTLDSLNPGTHILAFEHDALDSIGLWGLQLSVHVPAEGLTDLVLATPSHASLRRSLCRDQTPPSTSDSGVVFGSVADVHSEHRLAGALVRVSWMDLRQDRRRVDVVPVSRDVRSDSLGNYYICAVPLEQLVMVQGFAESTSSGATEVMIRVRGIARHDLTIARGSRVNVGPTGNLNGAARLRGRVVDETLRPVDGVSISVDDAGTASETDANGRFALHDLPAGSRMVRAQKVGFSPVAVLVVLRDSAIAEADLTVQAITVLDTLRVETSRFSTVLDALESRERANLGYRLRENDLHGLPLIRHAFLQFPRVSVGGRGPSDLVLTGVNASGSSCRLHVYLDGNRITHEELSFVRPEQLIAIEYFPRPSQAPLEYSGISRSCGVILIWTRYLR